MLIISEYLCTYETKQSLTFVLLSPDSPQLSLGETDEENSTKPHVQPTLLPPSPTLYHSSSSSVSPVAPLTTLEERGASLLHFPALTLLPSSPLCSPTQLPCFFLTSAKVCCFSPSSVCLSFAALRPCSALRVTSGMTDPWQEKSWQTAGVLQAEVFLLYLHWKILYFLPLKFNHSLPPLSLFLCLSLTSPLILSLTELWIFIRLPQRGNIYVLLHFFLSFQA